MCIEMVSYSAGHCPAHSISVIYKIMATMASATSSCYGFTEYAGEVVSVEVEGWGMWLEAFGGTGQELQHYSF
jgi:hypothetical protein